MMNGEKMKQRAFQVLGRLAERALADERRAAAFAKAIGHLQRARDEAAKLQEGALRSLGLASKSDYRDLNRELSSLRRRVRRLAESLDELRSRESGSGAGR